MSNEKKPFTLTREGLVEIEHSKTKGKAAVLPESVEAWQESGWTVVSDEQPGAVTPAKEK